MQTYRIDPICVGMFPGYEKSWLLYNTCCGEKLDVPVLAFLVRGPGQTILVDTGFEPSSAVTHTADYEIAAAESDLTTQLGALGVRPEQVDAIVHTHLHWDMCGNDRLFPRAAIYVQKHEVQYAIRPYECQYEEYETAHLGFSYPWLDGMDRFVYLQGDFEFAPGLRLLHLPGHSPGFQALLVATEKGQCLIAGDLIPLYDNWLGAGKGKKLPSTIHVNTADCLASFARVEQEADMILAGRDCLAAGAECLDLRKGDGTYAHL